MRSDDQLVALFRMGYDDAFRVIHDRYRERLFVYTRQMLPGSRSDAEDVLQDVFLRAYNALRQDNRPVTLRAWLYRVAHNRCVDQIRRPAPAPSEIFDVSRTPLHDPLVETQVREDLRRLVCDVRRLPEQQRSALLMREMEGLSYTELADALGVSVPSVKSLLVRARMGLVEAGEARDAACADIRAELSLAYDRGVRLSGRSRRHLRDCVGCRGYKKALRSSGERFGALHGGHGLATLAKLLGIGGAGSGAAVSGGAAAGGTGATAGGAALGGTAALGGGAALGGATIGGTAAAGTTAAMSAGAAISGGAAIGGSAALGGSAIVGGSAVVAKVAAVVAAAAMVGGGAAEVRVHMRDQAATAEAPSTSGAPGTQWTVDQSGHAVVGGTLAPRVVSRVTQPTLPAGGTTFVQAPAAAVAAPVQAPAQTSPALTVPAVTEPPVTHAPATSSSTTTAPLTTSAPPATTSTAPPAATAPAASSTSSPATAVAAPPATDTTAAPAATTTPGATAAPPAEPTTPTTPATTSTPTGQPATSGATPPATSTPEAPHTTTTPGSSTPEPPPTATDPSTAHPTPVPVTP